MLLLANLIALFHGLVVLPAITIVPLIFLFSKKRYPKLERAFLGIGGLTALSFLFLQTCFLTLWERQLRAAVDPALSYDSGFVRHYLSKIGIDIPDILTTIVLTSLLAAGFSKLLWNWWNDKN